MWDLLSSLFDVDHVYPSHVLAVGDIEFMSLGNWGRIWDCLLFVVLFGWVSPWNNLRSFLGILWYSCLTTGTTDGANDIRLWGVDISELAWTRWIFRVQKVLHISYLNPQYTVSLWDIRWRIGWMGWNRQGVRQQLNIVISMMSEWDGRKHEGSIYGLGESKNGENLPEESPNILSSRVTCS